MHKTKELSLLEDFISKYGYPLSWRPSIFSEDDVERYYHCAVGALRLFFEGRHRETLSFLIDYASKHHHSAELDPTIGIIQARNAIEGSRLPNLSDVTLSLYESDKLLLLTGLVLNLFDVQVYWDDLIEDNPKDEALKNRHLQLMVMIQYCLFHIYRIAEINRDTMGKTEKETMDNLRLEWEQLGLNLLNNYTGVHPFVIALCPPSEIWKQYIWNDQVHEVNDDGSITLTPVKDYDFTQDTLKPMPLPCKKFL